MKEENEKHFLKNRDAEMTELTGKHKAVLWVFGLTFFVMILGVIPWAWNLISPYLKISTTLHYFPR